MFSLIQQKARLASATPRNEFHGDETELKIDLKFTVDMPNGILREFDPELAPALFVAANDAQAQLDLGVAPLTKLKFPQLGDLKWEHAHAGYGLTLHCGISGHADIELSQCDFDKVSFSPQEGGTVQVGFRVIANPEEDDVGRICALAQKPVTISLTPPEAGGDEEPLPDLLAIRQIGLK